MKYFKRYLSVIVLTIPTFLHAQSSKGTISSKEYLERAETMYHAVWNNFRVPEHALFLENFPKAEDTQLDYFQGETVAEQEVSFLWPFSGLFAATNTLLKHPELEKTYRPYLDSLVDGIEMYKDESRQPFGYQAYPSKFKTVDRYYDDNGLVAIDYMESYFNTKNPIYLERAKEVFKFILSGWDDTLGGGVTWLEGHRDQKPACSNGMATLAALKIYEGTNDHYYLEWGLKFYNWMKNNLRNDEGLYANDKKVDGSIYEVYWTYNSGSMLEASMLLYKFTKDPAYLDEAETIASTCHRHFSTTDEKGHTLFQVDLPWFTIVLFRGYESLFLENGDKKYLEGILERVNFVWEKGRDQYGLVTDNWTANIEDIKKPKWLLNQACIAELYARASLLNL